MFIKNLNNKDDESASKRKLESDQLKDIVVSFESFINAIETTSSDSESERKDIDRQLSDVEDCLSQMISEFRANKIERVVSLALDVARNANEIFLTFAKSASATTATNI